MLLLLWINFWSATTRNFGLCLTSVVQSFWETRNVLRKNMSQQSNVEMTKMHLIEISALVQLLHRRLKSEVFRDNDATNTVKLSKKNEIIVWLRLSKCQEAIDRLRIVLRVIVAGKGITSSGFLRFLRKEKKPADRLMIACSCFQLSPTALSCKSYN
ncbi:unnamed protein product [Lactuca virosa]|uniref:Uncharacterized protein n=1 Tax=Lactuca virosa TaxID=75947 RepID=A0AAU9P6T8_9ASTR|nr:unnamed protein product [Lactuca virosa]